MTDQTPPLTWEVPQQLETDETRAATDAKTAILICHGMGKQLRFESLDTVVHALTLECKHRWGTLPLVKFGQVKHGPEWIPRAEITVTDGQGKQREIHLYEAYWAPLTEGKVNARDVTRFLFSAAWKGIRNSLSDGFDLWMFGKPQRFKYPIWTLFGIIGAFLLVCAVWATYVVLVTYATGFLTRMYQAVTSSGGSLPEALGQLFAGLNVNTLLWFLLLILAWAVRTLYIQYVGDVAAYISSHDVSKFNDIRKAIQDTVCKVATAVYRAQEPSGLYLYDRVVVAGHSLGSLIIYDALNRLINEELAEAGVSSVPARTPLLLTFGSPLDKIAFIFRTQKRNAAIREAFAANKQPMILNYEYRPKRWVNLHASMDPVSGRLDYFDLPDAQVDTNFRPRRIVNQKDPSAWMPLLAHNQYWDNQLFRTILMDELRP